jgi:hypothetical protein
MTGVPPLAFALGMYLPMELNTPVLLGGILSWLVGRKRTNDSDADVKAHTDRGVLLASGLIAGGAIMGAFDAIASAIIKQTTGSTEAKDVVHFLSDTSFEGIPGEVIGTIAIVALCVFVVTFARRAKPTE